MLRRSDIEACIVRQRTRLSVNTIGGFNESEGAPWGFPYRMRRDARRLALVCKFGFWSHLGCSGQNEVSFKGLNLKFPTSIPPLFK